MLKLQLRDVDGPLSTQTPGAPPATDAPGEEPEIWHDSSLELERGLDVQELSIDLHLCDLQVPTNPMPPEGSKRR